MAKQSPKDPKFRCNICKEYYHAPEHPVHYQCATHGYLCKYHIGDEDDIIYCHTYDRKNEEKIPDPKLSLREDPYYDKKYPLPTELVAKCMCERFDKLHRFPYKADRILNKDKKWVGFKDEGFDNYIKALNSSIEDSAFLSCYHDKRYTQCLKEPIKYTWNDNIKRWLEVGKDKEEDFIKDVKVKSNQKTGNPEIKLLVDLFEKNVLTKDQFLIQLKEILKF